ncbi:hypothetical protein [Spongiimicrobium sp. 3-5]|uniref:hypothetical protein n=1 Tax=Spongiimicrobium sp. 3-5 TaxID=3332596 RepID=UPI003980526D
MKTLKTTLLATLAILLIPYFGTGQEEEKTTQSFWVHEDRVKPSMVTEYEKAAKDLVTQCQQHDIKGLNWISAATKDFRYLFISPISSMADITYDGFGPLQEKMGEEAFNKLFSDMDKCYTAHGDYVITLDSDLSYMPDGMTQTPEGKDYRRFYYLHTTPENLGPITEAIKGVKALYERKGSKSHYRIYRSGFGTIGSFFMVAVADKDGISFETHGVENDALLGEDAAGTFGEVMKYVTEMEEVTGRMRPDLAYSPKD